MQQSSYRLSDPLRRAALRRAALLDTPAEEPFDRLTRFATKLLRAPVALVSLVDEDRQFFKSQCGLPEPWASERETPLSHSFCQHVVTSAEPLVIENARQYALVKDSLAIPDLGVEAYLGVPIWSPDGQVLGSFCVIDHEPRSWTAEELEALRELAASVMTEIELRTEVRKRIAAEEVQAELEAVIESIPDAVYIGTREGITRTNEAGLRMLGFRSLEELKGNIAAVAERTQPRDAASGEPIRPQEGPFARALDGEQVIREMVVRHVQTGEDRVVRAAAAPVRIGDEVRGAVAVTTDLTERKRATEALRASEERLQALIQASPLPIEALEADGTVTLWNPAAERTFGWTRDEIVGRPNPLIPDGGEEEHVALRRRVFGGESLAGVEVQRRRKDGTRIDVRLSTAPLRDSRGVITEGMGVLEDITEQKRMREALKESERRLSTLIGNLPGVVYRSRNDPRWTMEHIGGRTEELLGYAPEELMGEGAVSLAELIHAEDRDAVWQGIQEALAARKPFRLEYRIRTAAGEEKWIWEQGQGVFSREGEMQALEGFLTDVTERKKAEERERQLLRERAAREHAETAQRQIRSILESITDGFFAVDEHWHVTYANREILELVGKSSENVLGRHLWDLYPTPPESRFWTECHRAVRDQVAVEFEAYDPGSGLWVRVRAYPHEEGLAAFVRDITQRKRMGEALRRSEERFRNIVENMGEAVIITDLEERVLYANPRVEEIFGYSVDELCGKIASEVLMSPEERYTQKERTKDRAEGVSERYEVHHGRKGGARIWVEIDGVPFRNSDGEVTGTLGVVRDITERKRAEEALRAAKDEAEAASQAKSELLSRTSHELRTPMNAILGFAQLLEMEVEREENRESVEQILRAGNHLLRLIDEVLDIAEAESGQMTLLREPVHAGAALDEVVSLLRPAARRARVELPRNPLTRSDLHVLADPQRLGQVLLSLLSNAIKYNREGGRVDVVCDAAEEERVRIEVRDTGPGIPREKLSQLFAPFERAGAEQTHTEGTGLGLALSRALVEAMGGRIGAESTPGEGSTFWVELPRAPGEARAPERGAAEEGRSGDPSVEDGAAIAPVVLYVDDTPENLRLVERILRRNRPEVELITASGGREGLILARERRPELILLDLNLSDISGEKVLRALREEEATQEIPVVMISGDALPAQIEQLREAGAAEYLTKPFDIFHFLEIVDDILGGTEA